MPEVYYARSRKLGFAKLSPTSSTERVRKRIRSDVICKQRRSSASHSFIWFRISRRSYCVINGSAIRRHATVCHSFNSPIFLLKLSGSVMVSAPQENSRLALIPKESLTDDRGDRRRPVALRSLAFSRQHGVNLGLAVSNRLFVGRSHLANKG